MVKSPQIFNLYDNALRRARKRGLEFTITRDWIDDNLRTGRCALSGVPLILGQAYHLRSPSIDRINPRRGYTPDNSRIIAYAINRARGISRDAELTKLIKSYLQYKGYKVSK